MFFDKKIKYMDLWVNFECLLVLTLFFGDVRKLTCFWVAVLATTTLGRHVLISLKLIDMAFGYDVRWFIIESPVGRHVLNRLIVDKHGSGFLFSLTVFEEKSPYRVGRHVLNVFYFKRLRDMASLWDVNRHFSGWGLYVAFCNYHVGAPCSECKA